MNYLRNTDFRIGDNKSLLVWIQVAISEICLSIQPVFFFFSLYSVLCYIWEEFIIILLVPGDVLITLQTLSDLILTIVYTVIAREVNQLVQGHKANKRAT